MDTASISLTYSPDMIDDSIVNYESALRGLVGVIEHELRHFVGYSIGIDKEAMDNFTRPDTSFTDYYNKEYELDARLTALFISIARLVRGSALLAIQNKVDSMSKTHHELLKNGPEHFYRFCLTHDRKSEHKAMLDHILTPEMKKEAEGKCKEFYKYLFEKYAMALRAVKKEDVTKDMKAAWTDLHKAVPKTDVGAIKRSWVEQ